MKNISFAFIFTLIVSCFFISCEKDKVIDEQEIVQNLNQFLVESSALTDKIGYEFNKNKTINKDESFKNSLLAAKTENDLIILLKSAGIANSETIIELLKKRIQIENSFRTSTSDFYLFDINKRTELINVQFDLLTEKYSNPQSISSKTNGCVSSYKTGISRCNRDYKICSLFAVISASQGIIPGLIGGFLCGITFSNCYDDTYNDYLYCNLP